MIRMPLVLLLLAASPLLGSEPLAGQEAEDLPVTVFPPARPQPLQAEPFRAPLVNTADSDITTARYVFGGALVGAVGGVVWGTILMRNNQEWIGPPAYMATVPIGALVGGLAGGIIASLR